MDRWRKEIIEVYDETGVRKRKEFGRGVRCIRIEHSGKYQPDQLHHQSLGKAHNGHEDYGSEQRGNVGPCVAEKPEKLPQAGAPANARRRSAAAIIRDTLTSAKPWRDTT